MRGSYWCISDGNKAYSNFVKSKIESHQKQLIDVIPKVMNKTIIWTKKKIVHLKMFTQRPQNSRYISALEEPEIMICHVFWNVNYVRFRFSL